MSYSYSTKELVEALQAVEKALNTMGGQHEKQEAVKEYFIRMHRTLQQQFFSTVVMSVIGTLDVMYTTERTDLRNQAAAELAHKMLAAVDEEDRYLPLI